MTVPIPSRVSSSPVLNDTIFLDNNGRPLAAGLIYTYEGGGFTAQQTTFTTNAGDTANSNPIVLDASGRMQTGLWLADGFTYNFTLCDSSNVVLESFENIAGSVGVSAGAGIGTVIWNIPTTTPVYVSATQFYLVGDFGSEFARGNRVRWQFSDNTFGYGIVTAVVNISSNTYVTILPDAVGLSNQVVSIAWSALVVANYTVDAGAVGYQNSFSYAGANVGTKLQTIDNLVTQHAKSYHASLIGSDYTVTTGFAPTTYTDLVIDVIFDVAYVGYCTLNVNNIGAVALQMFDSSGALVNPIIDNGWCSRVMYNGSVFVMLEQLPYAAPPAPPPTFAPTQGTVATGGNFTVTAGSSGNIQVTVSCFAHALYSNFGEGNFKLYANGTLVNTQYVRFLEWDGRTGGCGATLFGVSSPGAGSTTTFHLVYSGPGAADYPNNWSAITA